MMNERIKAQLFALGLIDSLDASDEACKAALNGWFRGSGVSMQTDEALILAALQHGGPNAKAPQGNGTATVATPEATAEKQPTNEQLEARLADLKASAATLNEALGYEAVSAADVLAGAESKEAVAAVAKKWAKSIAEKEPPLDSGRVILTGEGADRYAKDVLDALTYRALASMDGAEAPQISKDAASHVRKPLWAIAGECLQLGGVRGVDMYGNREALAEQAMASGFTGLRHTFFSANEGPQYIQASAGPATRPGDFPNIMSGLANKFLDTVELDDDYSYPEVSAVWPGGLNDFKPGLLINKGIVEELDEVNDDGQIRELGLQEEVLSYIFMRRFANKFGWTPVMIANDDLGAFVEGMLGLQEAWQVTQNRLVIDRYTSGETLLDGSALFANRTDVGSATNVNVISSNGGVPSDAEWGDMEALYADIGGVGTGRRVRGTLNVWFGPTGTPWQEARRTFMPLNAGGLEPKSAETTANVGIYRGLVKLVPESELRTVSTKKWYGLRNPTKLNTATVIRAYFNGFGTAGRRERWYDPERKTTWVSLEGRMAAAVKNWRYAIENKGET